MSTTTSDPQQKAQAGTQAHPPMDPKIMELMQPGPEHAELSRYAGTWDVAYTAWMKPGAEPQKEQGTATIEVIHDGHYLCEEFTSQHRGKPFSGTWLTGFDRVGKQYSSVWCDNMGTQMVMMTGTGTGKVITMTGRMTCPMRGPMQMRHVITRESPDRYTVAMYGKATGEDEQKSMELIYTRRS